jgi:hypothetical protein
MRACTHCGGTVEASFRFCPWCATPLRRKLVEFFPASEAVAADHGKALRVSRYLDSHHVRFSVWDGAGTAEAAVSLDEDEGARLAAFLASPRSRRSRVQELLDRLGVSA